MGGREINNPFIPENEKNPRMKAVSLVALAILAVLVAGGLSGAGHATAQPPSSFREVPTQLCACQTVRTEGSAAGVPPSLRILAPTPTYDEQLGTTFTQSFTSLAFNVTAVEQTDPSSGEGPAYLLNGLGNSGYWYQVGVSWNWNPGTTPGTGFDMNYEVFNTQGASVFPANGNGGLQSFSGPVNQGDSVLLNMYFSSGGVVMLVHDWNTGASASVTFSAEGSTSFKGDANGVANNNGYFTGLMTEWYHSQPYTSNVKEVVYSESNLALTSAWMWMDEYNPNNLQSVFANSSLSALTFTSAPTKLQEFASNGATEYMDAYEFVTGPLNASSGTVPVVLSYSVTGGGSGYSGPTLFYVSGGIKVNATLGTTPATYNIDKGSSWSVTVALPGSTSTERWELAGAANGTAASGETVVLTYYHQYSASVQYSLKGSGGTPPDLAYTTFGSTEDSPVGKTPGTFWMDSGTAYSMTNPLQGSNSQERWVSAQNLNGTAGSPVSLAPDYFQQYLVAIEYSVAGGGDLSSSVPGTVTPLTPYFSGFSFGQVKTMPLSQNASAIWLDAGSGYNATQVVGDYLTPGSGVTYGQQYNERWVANQSAGQVNGGASLNFQYQHEYLVSLQKGPQGAGSLSTVGGWYIASSQLQASAIADSGWKLEYWSSASSSAPVSTNATLSLLVAGPVNDTAVFYPGLTITSESDVSVSYSYPSGITSGGAIVKGTVPAGESAVVYVPPAGVQLSASSSSFLYSFRGWSGASSSGSPSISLVVNGPASIGVRSDLNYVDIGIILAAVLLVLIAVVTVAGRSMKKHSGSPAA